MNNHNASSVAKDTQWRHELMMKTIEQITHPDFIRENQPKYQNQVLASAAVCCDKANCDREKIESMPEHYFRDPDIIFVAAQPFGVTAAFPPPGHGPAPERAPAPAPAPEVPPPPKKESQCMALEPYVPPPPFCPCVVNRGHLVTICCHRRDCEDSSKVQGRERNNKNFSHFKY
ncbi:uncharacterized protein LOC124645248 [Helicoverpa zea]|uniref:uncharacterized protein LOC124645248 n=1 Tax=Helicoverpa zea TaxID=7113 RepID=UPI001F587338|nr:uncharacterized protein LOC124645248 [Helicoverpa zea]